MFIQFCPFALMQKNEKIKTWILLLKNCNFFLQNPQNSGGKLDYLFNIICSRHSNSGDFYEVIIYKIWMGRNYNFSLRKSLRGREF